MSLLVSKEPKGHDGDVLSQKEPLWLLTSPQGLEEGALMGPTDALPCPCPALPGPRPSLCAGVCVLSVKRSHQMGCPLVPQNPDLLHSLLGPRN